MHQAIRAAGSVASYLGGIVCSLLLLNANIHFLEHHWPASMCAQRVTVACILDCNMYNFEMQFFSVHNNAGNTEIHEHFSIN
jgi:hypothetical protein